MANELMISDMNELERIGAVFVKSKFFSDTTDAAQAIVKIMAGRELGIAPLASMTGIHIIKGKPVLSANLIASKIKSSGKYNYRVKTNTATLCEIDFSERGDNGEWVNIGTSTFSIDDARKAGTQNLDKFPRNMLFARCLSNGAKWFCPDAFAGIAAYVPEELGAVVNEEGEVVTIESAPAVPQVTPPKSMQNIPDEAAQAFAPAPRLPAEDEARMAAATKRTPAPTNGGTQPTRKNPPMSAIQRNKIKELYKQIYGGTDIEIEAGVNDLFLAACQHDMSAATYEEAARITGHLLNEIRKTPQSA